MHNPRILFLPAVLFIFLSSCAPGPQFGAAPGTVLASKTDIPQQVGTIPLNPLTPPAESTSVDELGSESVNVPYQSPALGIQFRYPAAWTIQETPGSLRMTSFDPSNPPHKLQWTDQTVSMNFGFMVFIASPGSFDNWVETVKQAALSDLLSVTAEERFLIAGQPAAHLTLVSGSGGVIHRVLTILSGRYFQIDIEGNYNLARPVLDSLQPIGSTGLRPADSDTPAAGICGEPQGDPVSILLGTSADGLPLAGRCISITPAQHIRLDNQSGGPLVFAFGEYDVQLPHAGGMLLDKPVGAYLAPGVHVLPMGPELWVRTYQDTTPVPTASPPVVPYTNTEAGYSLGLPGDWRIDESGMNHGTNLEVLFLPASAADASVTFLSISLDPRSLDQIIDLYAQSVPEATREDVIFNGYPAVRYTYSYRHETYVPFGGKVFLLLTDRPKDGVVQSILLSIRFADPEATLDITMADNGKVFQLRVGEGLRLNLDAGYDWSVSVTDAGVIDVSQGVYRARAAGSAMLAALGNPKCLSSTPPCLAPSIMFQISVNVP